MGLLEQIQSGALFTRQTVTLSNSPPSSSTTSFGSSYVLLGVTANNPCRIRLYSDSASVAIDDLRLSSSLDISASVGLTFDGTLDTDLTFTFDPPVIGSTFVDSKTWYNISGSNGTNVNFTYYPIEQFTDRHTITIQQYALANNIIHEGTFTAPKAFILMSASADTVSRIRLYSVESDVPLSEKVRTVGTLPDNNSKLISDLLFDSASYSYILSPVLEAYNLNNSYTGTNTYSYIIQNRTGTDTPITASFYIYPLET